MTIAAAIAGALLILTILWEAFETIVLPRRIERKVRLTRYFYIYTWRPWSVIANRIRFRKTREFFLGLYGPLSLLTLIAVWAFGIILGFALMHFGVGSSLVLPDQKSSTITADIYMSGTTFFTLGLGDVVPRNTIGRFLTVAECGIGLGFLAVIIGYLPVIYQAFSRREVNISLLDARAGSPPTAEELLRRHMRSGDLSTLIELFKAWELWSAELLESHLSYPVLCYFRSQHTNQSWLSALTCVLDTCALIMSGIKGPALWQAELTFAMTRHAVIDLSQVFGQHRRMDFPERLPPEDLNELRKILLEAGVTFYCGPEADEKLTKLRAMYEPQVFGLGDFMKLEVATWLRKKDAKENWKSNPKTSH